MSVFLKYYVRDKESGVYHADKFDTIKAALVWIYNHTPKECSMFEYYEIVREDQIWKNTYINHSDTFYHLRLKEKMQGVKFSQDAGLRKSALSTLQSTIMIGILMLYILMTGSS